MDLSPLTNEQILIWADEHKKRTQHWPSKSSGPVAGTDETWSGINDALRNGNRGLSTTSTLAKLLADHRAVRNIKDLSPLVIEKILSWADEHKKRTGNWPNQKSGEVRGTEETWSGINDALERGGRGLPGGLSLAKLLSEQRDVRYIMDLPPLTIAQILAWADEHKKRAGRWPSKVSGPIAGTDENWTGINYALRKGNRGLPGGSSLSKLIAEHRGS